MKTRRSGISSRPSPWLQGLLPLRPNDVPREVIAGLTLAALAIPEVIGYTQIAGTPVISGLYTLLVPMLLFALFGSSRHLVVGADSATAALLAAALTGLAATGSNEYLALASALALLTGFLLLLARLIGLAFLADFMSRTVLVGFLTGVGIQVALGQLPAMLGIAANGHGTLAKLTAAIQHVGDVSLPALGLAALTLLITLGLKRRHPCLPGALVAILLTTLLGWLLHLDRHGIALVGAIPGGLPHPGLPQVSWSPELILTLLPTAFAMFVVILAQSAATARAYAARYSENFSEQRDLVGLGLANLGAALTGTFVVNGSPTKTQMVDDAGGRSQLAHLVTVLVVVLVLVFFTAPLAFMPHPALAAVVFMIGLELMDLRAMARIHVERRGEFWVALTTTLTVIFIGVEQGIMLAMVLSLLEHVRHGYHPQNGVLVDDEQGRRRIAPLQTHGQLLPGLMVYRFTHSLYYANSEVFFSEVMTLLDSAEPPLRWFCIDASAIDDIDFTAAETLRSLYEQLQARDIQLALTQISPGLRSSAHYELPARLTCYIFPTIDEVVAAYQRRFPE